MLKQWIIFNKLENFNSILNYTIDDFTPSGNLCYINEHDEILYLTPLKDIFNPRWYIQHFMDQSEDHNENPLKYKNWMKQTNWKFIKFVIHHKQTMTPEQLKQKPFKEIVKNGHEELDTKEGETNQEEEETTTSSDMSEQDSESDRTVNDTEESESPEHTSKL